MAFLFFKQKTAYEMRISDWSSDVCSSDLACIARHGSAVLAEQHKRGSDNGLFAVLRGCTRAQIAADCYVGNVAHAHRHALAVGDDGITNLIDPGDAGVDAREERLATAIDVVGADRDLVAFERCGKLGERDAEGDRKSTRRNSRN